MSLELRCQLFLSNLELASKGLIFVALLEELSAVVLNGLKQPLNLFEFGDMLDTLRISLGLRAS